MNKPLFLYSYYLFLFIIFTFPVRAGVIVSNGLSHLYETQKGSIIKGKIVVQNSDDYTQEVKIYQRDYSFRHTGEAFYNSPMSHKGSNADWVKLSSLQLSLQPKEKQVLNFEVHVPDNEELEGTYWSVIMIEGVESLDDIDPSLRKGINIQTQVRYAIQIATSIKNTGVKELEFLNVSIEEGTSQKVLQVDVFNKGNYLLTPFISLEVFSSEGESKGVFNSTKKKLYPNTSARYWVSLEGLSVGTYKALLLADSSEEDVFGTNITLNITND